MTQLGPPRKPFILTSFFRSSSFSTPSFISSMASSSTSFSPPSSSLPPRAPGRSGAATAAFQGLESKIESMQCKHKGKCIESCVLLYFLLPRNHNSLLPCSSSACAQTYSIPDPHHSHPPLSPLLAPTEKLRALECKKREAQSMQEDLVVFRQAKQLLKRKAAVLNMQLQQVSIDVRISMRS